ncbi:MAG: non-canonical purine NTP pyrophosphatase [Candidatus Sericytochromatia bacterium]
MSLLFLTGNPGKLQEVQAVLPTLSAWEVDLPEIQHADPRRVIEAKLLEAARLRPDASLLVEDTSLYLDALNGLPGPLIKWFIAPDSLGLAGLAELAASRGVLGATATTWFGLLKRSAEGMQLHFCTGSIRGEIVMPRGNQGFGWDPIFQPMDSPHTFAEMDAPEKQRLSMRRLALEKLQTFL